MQMGKCLNCGREGFRLKTRKCLHCGKDCCEHCTLFVLKIGMYDKWACSARCRQEFEQQVLTLPLGDIGTELDSKFESCAREYWYDACTAALSANDETHGSWMRLLAGQGKNYAMHVMETSDISSDGKNRNDLRQRFQARALAQLASNIERAGRPLAAAIIYEKNLKMYDKARQLREKEKQVFVRQTMISVDLNSLLQQIRTEGIVAVYRCPNCGGNLKINRESTTSALQVCAHCGKEIHAVDLADFLKTVLS